LADSVPGDAPRLRQNSSQEKDLIRDSLRWTAARHWPPGSTIGVGYAALRGFPVDEQGVFPVDRFVVADLVYRRMARRLSRCRDHLEKPGGSGTEWDTWPSYRPAGRGRSWHASRWPTARNGWVGSDRRSRHREDPVGLWVVVAPCGGQAAGGVAEVVRRTRKWRRTCFVLPPSASSQVPGSTASAAPGDAGTGDQRGTAGLAVEHQPSAAGTARDSDSCSGVGCGRMHRLSGIEAWGRAMLIVGRWYDGDRF